MSTGLQCANKPFTLFLNFHPLLVHTRRLSSVAETNCNSLQTNVLCLEVFSLFCCMSPIKNQIDVCVSEGNRKEE